MSDNSQSGGYDVPSLEGIDTPEQADAAINKLGADWIADSRHPYINKNHPQNREFVDLVNELWRRKLADEDPRPSVQRLTESAMIGQQEQREQRQQEAQGIADRLYEAGWLTQPEEMPDDLLPEEFEVIKTREQVASKEWDEVEHRIERDLTQLPKVDAEAWKALADLRAATKPKEKEREALTALFYIQNAYRVRIGLKPRQVQKDED